MTGAVVVQSRLPPSRSDHRTDARPCSLLEARRNRCGGRQQRRAYVRASSVTPNLTVFTANQLAFFKDFYTDNNFGIGNPTAAQMDPAARAVALGTDIGVALENKLRCTGRWSISSTTPPRAVRSTRRRCPTNRSPSHSKVCHQLLSLQSIRPVPSASPAFFRPCEPGPYLDLG